MGSRGRWGNSGEHSRDLFEIRHGWVIPFNRQPFSFLSTHHHQSENPKLSMWNCEFVWRVVVSTWTKSPARGSLPLLLVPFTRSHAYPVFSYQLSACSLVSRVTLTQPKSSSWHPHRVIIASPLAQVLCHWRLRWMKILWWLFQTGKWFSMYWDSRSSTLERELMMWK